MVVFEDGLAAQERVPPLHRPGAATEDGEPVTVDDTAAMREVLTRRFRRYLEDAEGAGDLDLSTGVVGEPTDGAAADATAPTDDDGRRLRADRPRDRPAATLRLPAQPRRRRRRPAAGQRRAGACSTSSASRRSRSSGSPSASRRCGCPRDDHPVILPRTSEGLYLLQRLRDEAHRFAITFHRQRRSKAMTTSQLDGIPGLGASRQKALLRHFGSVKRLRAADVDGHHGRTRHRPVACVGRRQPLG